MGKRYYKCEKCGGVFEWKPLKHGVSFASLFEDEESEGCNGKIVLITKAEYDKMMRSS